MFFINTYLCIVTRGPPQPPPQNTNTSLSHKEKPKVVLSTIILDFYHTPSLSLNLKLQTLKFCNAALQRLHCHHTAGMTTGTIYSRGTTTTRSNMSEATKGWRRRCSTITQGKNWLTGTLNPPHSRLLDLMHLHHSKHRIDGVAIS
jgi:hypothetical protein